MSVQRAALSVAVALGCSNKTDPAPPPAPVTPHDAGADGITTIGAFDPASGMHLDDDSPSHLRTPRTPPKLIHPLDVILRSTPPGARASIDGSEIGRTPTYYQVEAGREHEFTFVLEGYAFARYRFVPITSGVVHARMDLLTDDVDAGVPPEGGPSLQAPPPPATLVSPPVDAALRTPPHVESQRADAALYEVSDAGDQQAPSIGPNSGPTP